MSEVLRGVSQLVGILGEETTEVHVELGTRTLGLVVVSFVSGLLVVDLTRWWWLALVEESIGLR